MAPDTLYAHLIRHVKNYINIWELTICFIFDIIVSGYNDYLYMAINI